MDMARAVDAGLLRRLGALCLDLGLAVVGFGVLNLLLFKVGVLPVLAGDGEPMLAGVWTRPGVGQGAAVMVCVIVLACWRWLGATPGALLLGMVQVRARDGGRAGLARLIVRFAVAVGLAGLGLLWAARGRPALHDRLSGVRLVIEDEGLEALPSLDGTRR